MFHHYIIITGPPQREELLRKILGGGFLNFIKQNYTERRKTERKKEFKLTLDHRAHHREKKFFFRERKIKRFLNFIFEVCHNEVFFERPTFFISFSSFEQQWTERNL